MPIQIRPMRAEDVETCGRICYEAFKGISEGHNFRPDFPTAQAGIDGGRDRAMREYHEPRGCYLPSVGY